MPQWDIVPSALLEAWKQVARHLAEPCAKQGGVRRTGRFQVRQLPLFVPGDWAGCYPYARSMPAASSADEAVVPVSLQGWNRPGGARIRGGQRRGLVAPGPLRMWATCMPTLSGSRRALFLRSSR
jgi:hypothetical protein